MIEHPPEPEPAFYPSDPNVAATDPGYRAPKGYPEADRSNIVEIDPGQPVSQQIIGDAIARGRYDFNGLSWMDGSGVTHVVRDRDVRHIRVGTSHEPAGLSRVLWERKRRIFGPETPDGRWPNGKLWPFEVREPYDIPKDIPTLGVDEYDADGNLLSVRLISEDGLMRYFDNLDVANAEIDKWDKFGIANDHFWWQEKKEHPAADRVIPIKIKTDAHIKEGPGPSIFDAITRMQQFCELRDWSGLRYSLRGQDVTIDREVSRRVRTFDGWKNERAFVMKRVSTDGLEAWEVVTAEQLKKELDGVKGVKNIWSGVTDRYRRTERRDLNLRFEVPSVPAHIVKPRWLGHALLEDRRAKNVAPDPEINDDIKELLGYTDAPIENDADAELIALRRQEIWSNPASLLYAKALCDVAAELDSGKDGVQKLEDLAKRIRSNYLARLKRVDIPATAEDKSISWVLWELAKQRYFHDNPHKVRGGSPDFSTQAGSAVGYDIEARKNQNELIDSRVGEAFDRLTVIRHQELKKQLARLPNGAVKFVDGDPVEVIVPSWYIDLEKKPIENLNGTVREAVRKILAKVTPENLELSYADHVKLGRLLREQ